MFEGVQVLEQLQPFHRYWVTIVVVIRWEIENVFVLVKSHRFVFDLLIEFDSGCEIQVEAID